MSSGFPQTRSPARIHHHVDTVDEEACKGKRGQHRISRRKVSTLLKRLCLKPRSYLTTKTLSPHGRPSYGKATLLFLFFVGWFVSWSRPERRSLRHESDWSLEAMPVTITKSPFSREFCMPPPLAGKALNSSKLPDYGLYYKSLQYVSDAHFGRKIARNDYKAYERQRKKIVDFGLLFEEWNDSYYQNHEEFLDLECRRSNFEGLYFPNCNHFHEMALLRGPTEAANNLGYFDAHQVSYGGFRDVWVLRRPTLDTTENVVLKTLRTTQMVNIATIKGIQREAIILERLSSSPRIVEVYGHCGTSMAVEAMKHDVQGVIVPGTGYANQTDIDKYNDLHPMNNYTIEEKLQLALQMAESIADLHGYEGGVIVHDDVQLCQWLENEEGKLKLGDFNSAEVMQYNEKNASYCKYQNGFVNGNYRSPEEMRNDYLDEKLDVFSFGNNIYALLTGLWVFYTHSDDDELVQNEVIAGTRAYIDDRYRHHSYVERKMIELMEQCWVHDPAKRVDIFEVVRFLRKVLQESKERPSLLSADFGS